MRLKHFITTLATFLAMFTVSFAGQSVLAETCNESQAYNKMLAFGRAQSRIVAEGGQVAMNLGGEMTVASGPASELIAQKKFDEACAKYEELAKKYGIDLNKEQQGMVTIEELAKDGGKRGGECGIVEAQKKMMGMHEQLQDKVALGDADQDVFRQFGEDTAKIGELMSTNPSEACRQLDALKPKYKVQ